MENAGDDIGSTSHATETPTGLMNLSQANAFRYRDYVVEALDADLPFNQFIHEQLAGDLLNTSDTSRTSQRLTATGFLVIGAKMLAEDDPVKMQWTSSTSNSTPWAKPSWV